MCICWKTFINDTQKYSIVTSISIMSVLGLSLGIIYDVEFGIASILFIGSIISGGIMGYFIPGEFKDRTDWTIQEYHEYFSLLYPIRILITLLLSFFVARLDKKGLKKTVPATPPEAIPGGFEGSPHTILIIVVLIVISIGLWAMAKEGVTAGSSNFSELITLILTKIQGIITPPPASEDGEEEV